jgi:hypothetical protein
MISDIIKGLTKELKYFCEANEGMVVLDTNMKEDIAFSLPLIVLCIDTAKTSKRLPGGLTQMDYDIYVDVYSQAPDAYVDDDTTNSTSHLDYGDLVRNHLENEVWITQEMVDLVNNYTFRLTYSGTTKADNLKTKDSTLKGFKHTFESICYDRAIIQTIDITETAQTVVGSMEFE